MKIAMNSTCPQTDDQLSDPEYWDELQRSGYRKISSREFAHRPSTRIDPEILRRINRPAFVPENEASTRPGQKRNGRARRVIDSSVPPHIRVKLGSWIHVNLQERDSLGNTPLHRAVMKGEPPAVIEFLSNKGVDVNARNRARETALFIAASNGRASLVNALLKMGASPNLRNAERISPLKAASVKGYITTVNELMSGGAKDKARKGKGRKGSGSRHRRKMRPYTRERDWFSSVTEGDLQ